MTPNTFCSPRPLPTASATAPISLQAGQRRAVGAELQGDGGATHSAAPMRRLATGECILHYTAMPPARLLCFKHDINEAASTHVAAAVDQPYLPPDHLLPKLVRRRCIDRRRAAAGAAKHGYLVKAAGWRYSVLHREVLLLGSAKQC